MSRGIDMVVENFLILLPLLPLVLTFPLDLLLLLGHPRNLG